MEEHYFLRAWKLRQGMAEEAREAAPEMEVCFQFFFACAAHRNEEGESHIEAIFFVGSGAAEWKWRFSPSVIRAPPSDGRPSQRQAHSFSQPRPRISKSPLALRVYIAWGHFRPRLYGGCCFQNAMTPPLQIATGNSHSR